MLVVRSAVAFLHATVEELQVNSLQAEKKDGDDEYYHHADPVPSRPRYVEEVYVRATLLMVGWTVVVLLLCMVAQILGLMAT